MADMLDTGFPPSTPQQCIGDVKAAGARAVGLYILNWSAPSTVVSQSYMQTVAQAGIQVLPIVTPGMVPPAVTGLPSVLAPSFVRSLNSTGLVGLDIEQPGIDTPGAPWVQAFLDVLLQAGLQLLEYTNLRAQYPFGLWWAVNWNVWPPPIPAGAAAVQGGNSYRGPSGAVYDQSFLQPNVLTGAPAPDPVPTEVTDMPLIGAIEGNAADPQDFAAWTDAQGTLHARTVNADDPASAMGSWDDTENAGNFVPNQAPSIVMRADGMAHFYLVGKDGNAYCLWLNTKDPHGLYQRQL